ncbi:hypothetical protein [Actinomadura roseirufa]|uniref:hypothetical protein n=1 Tax=Actinomadura roseirufa TaxID=2094049 RepID=UPI0010419195|nr:hypothetical protein [Actinomadura roseirufa]
MIRTIVGGVAAGSLALTALIGLPAASASAVTGEDDVRDTPTYTCDLVSSSQLSQGILNCQASNGAVKTGGFTGDAILRDRRWGVHVLCHGGGMAHTPNDVQANECDAGQG